MAATMLPHRLPPRTLARVLLACFALVLALAAAAPWARAAQGLERLCSASGQELWVASAADGQAAPADTAPSHALECALCLPALAAPPATARSLTACAPPLPLTASLRPVRHRAPLSRAPFPPRAPPAPVAHAA